jgi:hypothetical protein
MKAIPFYVAPFLLAVAVAQQPDTGPSYGVIYGSVIGQDGKPARGIALEASPLGVGLATRLPRTRTNDLGEYHFENIPWWGKYSVSAEDDYAGYSVFSTGGGRNDPPEVELMPEHPVAEMKVYLPPKAGLLHIRLTNRRSGASISGMQVSISPAESPEKLVFSMSCDSNHVVLVQPDKNVLLHVTSDGYREWDESVGKGKPLRLASGERLTFDVQLEPLD